MLSNKAQSFNSITPVSSLSVRFKVSSINMVSKLSIVLAVCSVLSGAVALPGAEKLPHYAMPENAAFTISEGTFFAFLLRISASESLQNSELTTPQKLPVSWFRLPELFLAPFWPLRSLLRRLRLRECLLLLRSRPLRSPTLQRSLRSRASARSLSAKTTSMTVESDTEGKKSLELYPFLIPHHLPCESKTNNPFQLLRHVRKAHRLHRPWLRQHEDALQPSPWRPRLLVGEDMTRLLEQQTVISFPPVHKCDDTLALGTAR